MASKMIKKIKYRLSYYYFDQALKGQKSITMKYPLFADDVCRAVYWL